MKRILFALVLFVYVSAITQTVPNEKLAEIESFWTPERLRSAVPMEFLLMKTRTVFPRARAPIDTDYVPEADYSKRPYAQTGKIFFEYNGQLAACSGCSSGKNVVITAGHCVAMDGKFHEKWIFIPQYNNGSTPHGKWTGTKKFVFESWFKNQDLARDVAFVVVASNEGKTLEEKVGALPAGICEVENKEKITAIGYPHPVWGGQKMVRTHDRLWMKFELGPFNPPPIGILSKMGAGSSGGPWVMKYSLDDPAGNIQCSVNSFGLKTTDLVFGPQFDEEVLAMRNQALKS